MAARCSVVNSGRPPVSAARRSGASRALYIVPDGKGLAFLTLHPRQRAAVFTRGFGDTLRRL
jgi:hypothetical protein